LENKFALLEVCHKIRFTNRPRMNKRKSLATYLNLFLAIAVAASLPGCAAQTKEVLLTSSGFQARTPSTPKQQAIYNSMTPDKLEHGTYKGKSIYAYADKKKGVVYIGGETAYQQAVARYKLEVSEKQREESAAEAFGVNLY
jgi:hypothetical protein